MAVYCSKTLKTLSLNQTSTFLFDVICVPFSNVKSIFLSIPDANFKSSLHFKRSFPNLYTLSLELRRKLIEPINIIDNLPSLRQLTMTIQPYGTNMEIKNREDEFITEFLKLNPQLEKFNLKIYGEFSIRVMRCVCDFSIKLESFSVFCESMCGYAEIETFHLKNVVDFNLSYFGNNYIPFTFDKLNSFKITCFDHVLNSHILDFITKNELLKNLHIDSCIDPMSSLIESEFVLSNIEYLTISGYYKKMSPDSVVSFLNVSRSLKQLTLIFRVIDTEWQNYSFNAKTEAKISIYRTKSEPWNTTFNFVMK